MESGANWLVAIDAKYDDGTNSTELIVSNFKYTGNSDAEINLYFNMSY